MVTGLNGVDTGSPSNRPLILIVPGRLATRTGGYEYDRRMAAALAARGWEVHVRELDESFPHPTRAALDEAARVLSDIPDGTTVLADGLALGAMPDPIERERSRLKIVALVHLPLAAAVGLDGPTAARLEASERRALAATELVVVTGRSTRAALAAYGVAPDRLVVVEPGTARAPLARGSTGVPLRLLSVAAVTAGKGHEILVDALAAVPNHDWLLTCAGSLDREPLTVARVRARVSASGLESRVSLVGELGAEGLEVCYDSADVFVLASLHETYCMAVAEALAHGLPVVSTMTGAIPDLVGGAAGDPSAGLVVPPGDVNALAAALTQVLADAPLRQRLAAGARRVRDRLPTWEEAADKLAAALHELA
jgi:glycosyltransferase involved in cell wall biosynthesis